MRGRIRCQGSQVPLRSFRGRAMSGLWRREPCRKTSSVQANLAAARAVAAPGSQLLENATTRRLGLPELSPRRPALDTAAHGLFRAATDQRPRARLDLRPDRHRLHHGLRHRRHDQFRPWRYFHDRRLHRPDHLPDPGLVRPDRHPADPADRSFGIDGHHGALWLDGGAHRLPAAAALVPPGADAFGDRDVIRADQFFAGSPGRTRQTGAADHHRWLCPA